MARKVNSANTLYLVIESVKPDTKHEWLSSTPVPADGAGSRENPQQPRKRLRAVSET